MSSHLFLINKSLMQMQKNSPLPLDKQETKTKKTTAHKQSKIHAKTYE